MWASVCRQPAGSRNIGLRPDAGDAVRASPRCAPRARPPRTSAPGRARGASLKNTLAGAPWVAARHRTWAIRAYSVLDLAPVIEGGDTALALRCSLDLARHAEQWGYRRFWLAEHPGMPGNGGGATAVVMGHVAAGTTAIRVGAGGIMLPNHAPLVIAEQFGTLESLFPGRIDLGVGRAPGTDQITARALRRNLATDADSFPQDVIELMSYFGPVRPDQQVRAIPGAGLDVPVWILGSSLFGAQLAAALGLPYAVASHFAPAEMERAMGLYRSTFRPSDRLAAPYVMLGLNVCAAESDAQARYLFSSHQQAVIA